MTRYNSPLASPGSHRDWAHAQNPTCENTYDGVTNGIGELTSVGNLYSTTGFTAFDALQSVTASKQVTTGSAYTFGYGYNLAEALTSETYPSGRVVTTGYDAANRQVTVNGVLSGQTTNYVTGTSYWANGGVTSMTRGNGLVYGETYNNRLQMAGMSEKLNSSMHKGWKRGWPIYTAGCIEARIGRNRRGRCICRNQIGGSVHWG